MNGDGLPQRDEAHLPPTSVSAPPYTRGGHAQLSRGPWPVSGPPAAFTALPPSTGSEVEAGSAGLPCLGVQGPQEPEASPLPAPATAGVDRVLGAHALDVVCNGEPREGRPAWASGDLSGAHH